MPRMGDTAAPKEAGMAVAARTADERPCSESAGSSPGGSRRSDCRFRRLRKLGADAPGRHPHHESRACARVRRPPRTRADRGRSARRVAAALQPPDHVEATRPRGGALHVPRARRGARRRLPLVHDDVLPARGGGVVAGAVHNLVLFTLPVVGGTGIYDNVGGTLTATFLGSKPIRQLLLFRLTV